MNDRNTYCVYLTTYSGDKLPPFYMVNGMKGKTHTEETKKQMSQTRSGELNGMYGQTHTEEARKKIGDVNRGKEFSQEWKDKIGQGSKRRWDDPEIRENLLKKRKESGSAKKLSDHKKSLPDIQCPHCGKVGRPSAGMHAFHFNRCKQKPIETTL